MAFNVLLVDDSKVTRKMIGRTLHIAELPIQNVYEAEDGQTGLQRLLTNRIDVVIADINMPVMTGIEMIKTMQSDPQLSKIPVVVISTEGSRGRQEELRGLGVRAYIRKPFTPEELRDTLREVLGELRDETGQGAA